MLSSQLTTYTYLSCHLPVYLPIDIQENKHICPVLFVIPANRKDLPVDWPVDQQTQRSTRSWTYLLFPAKHKYICLLITKVSDYPFNNLPAHLNVFLYD